MVVVGLLALCARPAAGQPAASAEQRVGSLLSTPGPRSGLELDLAQVARDLAALGRSADANSSAEVIGYAERALQDARAQLAAGDARAAQTALGQAGAGLALASRRGARGRAQRMTAVALARASSAEADLGRVTQSVRAALAGPDPEQALLRVGDDTDAGGFDSSVPLTHVGGPPSSAADAASQQSTAMQARATCAFCAGGSCAAATRQALAACLERPEVTWAAARAPDLVAMARQAAAGAARVRGATARPAAQDRARLLLDAAIEEAGRIEAETIAERADRRWAAALEARAARVQAARDCAEQLYSARVGAIARQRATWAFAGPERTGAGNGPATGRRTGDDSLLHRAALSGDASASAAPSTSAQLASGGAAAPEPSTARTGACATLDGPPLEPSAPIAVASADASLAGAHRDDAPTPSAATTEQTLPRREDREVATVLAERAAQWVAAACAMGLAADRCEALGQRIDRAAATADPRARVGALRALLPDCERALGDARRPRGPSAAEAAALLELAQERGLTTEVDAGGVAVVLRDAFAPDGSTLSRGGVHQLEQLAALLRAHPHGVVRTELAQSTTGTARAAQLGERRLRAIVQALMASPEARGRIEIGAGTLPCCTIRMRFTAYHP